MPWTGEKDPYKIWLSEIILQQTRVEQGLPYFKKFVDSFPTVFDLANAREDKVMRLWQGLGYYSRARNLHATANHIANKLNGKFPDHFEEIIKLKGIGIYTASAISSFAFNEVRPVVDGNVIRVISRYFGVRTDPYSNSGKKIFLELAKKVIDRKNPGVFNQAIMDFGARQCKPQNPDCMTCPMNPACYAFRNNCVNILPPKKKKIKQQSRYFHFLLIQNNQRFVLQKRTAEDIWKGLYSLPLIENQSSKKLNSFSNFNLLKKDLVATSEIKNQLLTHQKINARFYHFRVSPDWLKKNISVLKISSMKNLNTFGFPKIIEAYLRELKLLSH